MSEPLKREPVTPDDPTVYRKHIDTIFVVSDAAASSVRLRLAAVFGERVAGAIRQFSLFFHGPPDRVLSQGTYHLDHDAIGPLSLFLVPVIGSNNERIVYEACFTTLVVSSATPSR